MTKKDSSPVRYAIVQNTIMHYRIPLYENMAARPGIDLTVIHSDAKIAEKAFGFKTTYLPSTQIASFYFQNNLLPTLRNFDIILCMFDLHWVSIIRAILSADLAPKIYLWTHGYGRNKYLNGIRVALAKRCRGLVLYYQEFAESFIDAGVPANKIFESSNTVEVTNAGIERETERDSFLYVGRVQERKKIAELIMAFAELSKSYSQLRLVIVGDGDELGLLKAEARRLSVENRVEFTGKCTDEGRLKRMFSSALAYVSPGHVGLGVLHAFAYGCPVITDATAYHAPEFVNLVDGENAILYKNGYSGLLRNMKRLVNEPRLSTQLGENAHELYVTKRSMEVMADNLISLP